MLGNKGTKKYYRTGGTRGGQDQFNWEDVKADKERENYLGHSLHAPVGRWQKGRDLLWYARGTTTTVDTANTAPMATATTSTSASTGGHVSSAHSHNHRKRQHPVVLNPEIEEERKRMRALDEELLNNALGIRNPTQSSSSSFSSSSSSSSSVAATANAPQSQQHQQQQQHHNLDKDELKQLIARGKTEIMTVDNAGAGKVGIHGEVDEYAGGTLGAGTKSGVNQLGVEGAYAERIKGLGAAPAKFHEHIDRISQLERQIQLLKEGKKHEVEREMQRMHRLPGSDSSSSGWLNNSTKATAKAIANVDAIAATSNSDGNMDGFVAAEKASSHGDAENHKTHDDDSSSSGNSTSSNKPKKSHKHNSKKPKKSKKEKKVKKDDSRKDSKHSKKHNKHKSERK